MPRHATSGSFKKGQHPWNYAHENNMAYSVWTEKELNISK